MITQEQLNARREAANYIDNRGDRERELAEIRQLQELLTPSPVIVPAPVQEATSSQPRKTVKERLAEQCAAKLASGQPINPDLVKFLTAMSQAH
jgi:transcription elongation GreA/GreB family factor